MEGQTFWGILGKDISKVLQDVFKFCRGKKYRGIKNIVKKSIVFLVVSWMAVFESLKSEQSP